MAFQNEIPDKTFVEEPIAGVEKAAVKLRTPVMRTVEELSETELAVLAQYQSLFEGGEGLQLITAEATHLVGEKSPLTWEQVQEQLLAGAVLQLLADNYELFGATREGQVVVKKMEAGGVFENGEGQQYFLFALDRDVLVVL